MIGLRHMLVHNYVHLDPKQLHEKVGVSRQRFVKLMSVLLDHIRESGMDPLARIW
jgi:uncharacterized protein YutE (UPF0331/DUF86 family)